MDRRSLFFIYHMKIKEIIAELERHAPSSLQESYDNTGYQCGDPEAEATGALLCMDVTEEIVREAQEHGLNLIVSHHPLLFRGVKAVIGRNRPERALAEAIRRGVTVYSSHTAMDSTRGGVSARMARNLGLKNARVLAPSTPGADTGLGVVGDLEADMTAGEFAALVKRTFGCEVLRASHPAEDLKIKRVALCGGSAAEFVPEAIAAGAQVYVTADVKLNQFLDHAPDIWLIDAGHFETEECTKQIFFDVISEKFPNFALRYSTKEKNPVLYL